MNEPKRIVFVCVENSCRSQIAEGFARVLAPADVEIYSAGSRPSGKVNERAIAFMREAGIDISGQESKGLNDLPDATFARAITMGCGDECPFLRAEGREDWGLADPKHLDDESFRRVRDEIRTRVQRLLEQFTASPSAHGQNAAR